MKLLVSRLSEIVPLVAFVSLAACTASQHQPLLERIREKKTEHKKDYSALRIRGRETIALAGVGTIHADKHEKSADGTIKLSGRVFVELVPGAGNSGKIGKTTFLFAYAEKARWDGQKSILCLEGLSIVEASSLVVEATEDSSRVYFDKTGKMTSMGLHSHSFY